MEYKHFSHHHNLNIYHVQPGQQFCCSGCQKHCSDTMYACWQCNFFLHEHCGNANRYVKHPCHALHPLTLVPSPTYSSGAFLCNACGTTGNAFSYCCALCEVDLHVHCAFLPPRVNHKLHLHELALCFSIGEQKASASSQNCKICNQLMDSKSWSYYCIKCDFRVHTYCATTEVKQGLYQMEESSDPPIPGVDHQPITDEKQQESGEVEEGEAGVAADDPVVELYKLQLQMQMAEQLAQMMSSVNISHLV